MNETKDEEQQLNTVFEQDGKIYAVCAHCVPPRDLAKFIREELLHGTKYIPRFKMRVVTTAEFRAMPFGKPSRER